MPGVERRAGVSEGRGPDKEKRGSAASPCFEVRRLIRADRTVTLAERVAHRAHENAISQRHRADLTGRQQMIEPTHVRATPSTGGIPGRLDRQSARTMSIW